ncbi:FG-GAP-like repeat-containing protein [Viscerimonas tarda]
MRKYKFLFAALIGCLLGVQTVKAQVIIANPDDFFVQPNNEWGASTLDVLANDFYGDACQIGDLVVTVTAGPYKTSAWAGYDPTTHTILYIPGEQSGVDSLVYSIQCPSSPAPVTAKAYIYIGEKPGPISDASCFTKPEGIKFDIAQLTSSSYNIANGGYQISTLSEVFGGDIDNDGKVELIVNAVRNGSSYNTVSNLVVYNYNETTKALDVKYVIPVTGWTASTHWSGLYVAIAKITDGSVDPKTIPASIFFANPKMHILYRYDKTGTGTGAYTETWSVSLNENDNYHAPQPFITDLMGDGNQQIICGERIFNAETGQLLMVTTNNAGTAVAPTTAGAGGLAPAGYYFSRGGHQSPTVGVFSMGMIAVDVDGDGYPELIGGGSVYKVHIEDYTSQNPLNTYRLWRRANYKADFLLPNAAGNDYTERWDATRTDIGDGTTGVVDIDLDGKLDVIVGCKDAGAHVYVYNPRTGQLYHNNRASMATNGGPSRPFAGDIDGDGYPEFAVTSASIFEAYKLDIPNRNLVKRWSVPTSDTSANTTMSMFDFAQDGQARMIYRDITTLRIIKDTIVSGVPQAKVEATFSNVFSGTLNEYPSVIDIDNDGHAEIATTMNDISGGDQTHGMLRVYAANTTVDSEKWAPARNLWHQAMYNPLWVNDDLTIPKRPISPAAKFIAADGTITRPFNNFLQQSTMLNLEGTMTTEGADLTFRAGAPRKIEYDGSGNMSVKVTIQNIGGVVFTGPINFQMYSFTGSPAVYQKVVNSDPASGGAYSYRIDNASGLNPGASLAVSFTVPVGDLPVTPVDGYAITMNLTTDPGDLSPAYSGMEECHEGYNNRALGFNALDGMTILCEGSSGTLIANPINTYNIQWYLPTPGGNVLQDGGAYSDTRSFGPKDSAPVSYMLVQAFYKTTGAPVSPLLDTIYVYRAPDSLVWRKPTNDGDWHNPDNWYNPADPTGVYPLANIPQTCTNVLITAGGGLNFPDLGATTTLPYPPLGVPTADSIYFNFGGEIKRPDLLTYNKAFVEANLRTHRWYMFAPPLKNFYVGDFYVDNPIPAKDSITAYIKVWGINNSSNGSFSDAIGPEWSWLLTEPDVTFEKGQGVGVWVSDNKDKERIHPFAFPKKDLSYNIYYKGTDNISPDFPTFNVSRTNANRFIFDGSGANGANFDLTTPDAPAAGRFVMVGNPFMAHLDFDKFHAANSGKIKNEYRILNPSTGNYDYYKIGSASTLTKDIAPMQAFIVEAIAPFTTLTVNGAMTERVPGNTIRSAAVATDSNKRLDVPVTATQGASRSKTYISFGDNYAAGFDGNEDVMALFSSTGSDVRPIGSYSLSGDGKRVNLNSLPYEYLKTGGAVPLGFRTPSNEKITINIGNLTNLVAADCKAYLYDAATGKDYDLTKQSMYTFDNVTPDENLFIDNRFSLKIVKVETGLAEAQTDDESIVITVKDKLLHIESQEVIDEVFVYNVQGQIIYSARPNNHSLNATLGNENLVIVKVYAGGKTVSKKIIK